MAVSLDLADPVLTTVSLLENNISAIPVEVANDGVTSYTRGGYAAPFPKVFPVEGAAGKPRKGVVDVKKTPEKCRVYVYMAGSNPPEDVSLNQQYQDTRYRVSIDIYQGKDKARLISLFNEYRRIIMLNRLTPGGNYTEIEELNPLDFTNRTTGIFRYVYDIFLVKISEYVGHI